MKLRHTFLIALGVALPVWIRQQRFEHQVVAELERFSGAIVEAHTELVEWTNGTLQRLVEELGGGR